MSEQAAAETGRRRTRPLRYAVRAAGIGAVLALVALLAYGVISKSPNTRIDDSLARARAVPAPSFRLAVLQRGSLGPQLSRKLAPALADGRVALKELRGTPVVLNFWASWCVPCREEAPLLQRTWREQARPRGVLFLGLDMQDVTSDARDNRHPAGFDRDLEAGWSVLERVEALSMPDRGGTRTSRVSARSGSREDGCARRATRGLRRSTIASSAAGARVVPISGTGSRL